MRQLQNSLSTSPLKSPILFETKAVVIQTQSCPTILFQWVYINPLSPQSSNASQHRDPHKHPKIIHPIQTSQARVNEPGHSSHRTRRTKSHPRRRDIPFLPRPDFPRLLFSALNLLLILCHYATTATTPPHTIARYIPRLRTHFIRPPDSGVLNSG